MAAPPTAASPANPHRPTSRAEIAPILSDHRQIPALAAQLAGGGLRGVAAGRGLQDSHLLQRHAVLVEDAEHRVAVDDQLREVGNGRGVVGLAAGAGDEGHEVAERFGVVEQLPQLHADPRRVEHAHVERQQLGQAVERAGVVAGEPDRVRARHAVGQGDFLEAENEVLAGRRVEDVHRPRERAVGAGFRLLAAEHGVEHRRRSLALEGAEALDAVLDQSCHRRDHRGHALPFAVRREGHVEALVAGRLCQRFELQRQPAVVVGTHEFGDARAHRGRFRAVVAQAQNAQGVVEAGKAEADVPLVGGYLAPA